MPPPSTLPPAGFFFLLNPKHLHEILGKLLGSVEHAGWRLWALWGECQRKGQAQKAEAPWTGSLVTTTESASWGHPAGIKAENQALNQGLHWRLLGPAPTKAPVTSVDRQAPIHSICHLAGVGRQSKHYSLRPGQQAEAPGPLPGISSGSSGCGEKSCAERGA